MTVTTPDSRVATEGEDKDPVKDLTSALKDRCYLVMCQQAIPQRLFTKNLRVSKNNNSITSTCQCNIEPPWIIKESNSLKTIKPAVKSQILPCLSEAMYHKTPTNLMLVTSDTGQYDVIFFSSLKRINTGNL